MSTNNESFSSKSDNICRCCLNPTSEAVEIFEAGDSLRYILSTCTGLQISKSNDFPLSICPICINQLYTFYEFRNKCIKSNEILTRCLKLDGPLIENVQKEVNLMISDTFCKGEQDYEDDAALKTSDDDVPLLYMSDLQQRSNGKMSQTKKKKNKSKTRKKSGIHTSPNASTKTKSENLDNLITIHEISTLGKKKDGINVLTCRICHESFLNKEQQTAHKQTHYFYQCKKCEHRSKSLQQHTEHECSNKETMENPNNSSKQSFEMEYIANSKINDQTEIIYEDIDVLSYVRVLACHFCNRELKSSRSLRYHLRSHTGEKPHLCTMCGKKFREERALVNHIRAVHTGEKRFTCAFCPKAFTVSGKRRLHERVHTGEKPYQCSICCRLFAARSTLNAHMRRHTRQEHFTCKLQGCNQAFYSFSTYQRHTWAHRGERPYQCDRCPKTYLSSQNLRSHFKAVHSQLRDEICHICNKEFAEKSTLNRHLRTIHKSEPKNSKKPVAVYGFPTNDNPV